MAKTPEGSLSWWDRRKILIEIVIALAGVIGIVLGLGSWIDGRARDAVMDEKFLAELAAKIRPACIFDSRGVILTDMGASELIDSIKVKEAPEIFGFEVMIKFKKHLTKEPVVTGLSVNLFPETVTRGPDHVWSFILTPASTLPALLTEADQVKGRMCRFKLEILH